jgi:REP element-mobilizing transposase RayT
VDGYVSHSQYGQIGQKNWLGLPNHFPYLSLDDFVVMPNHLHGILILSARGKQGNVGAGLRPALSIVKRQGISGILRAFKGYSTREINAYRGARNNSVWERNYYEHIIRDGEELNNNRRYITENPMRWRFDRENPASEKNGIAEQWECN